MHADTLARSINADFAQPVVVRPSDQDWVGSPLAGVERRPLDRIGGEVARATSIVRYLPGARFSRHVHGGGEEFLVLEGLFSDTEGHYPAGTYVRNPPGSSHAPYSEGGCVLFVKLWQFAADDLVPQRTDIDQGHYVSGPAPGLQILPLHRHGALETAVLRWVTTSAYLPTAGTSLELLVLEGSLRGGDQDYPAGTWIRRPATDRPQALHADAGTRVLLKTGAIGAPEIPLPPD